MNKSQLRFIFIIALIAVVIGISVYAELVVLPSKMNTNSKQTNLFAMYFHSNLSVIVDNKHLIIPSQIGINESLWKNHTLDKYGIPGMPMDKEGKVNMPGMAPLYTNNANGQITIGSIVNRNYTLGDFLAIWGGLDLNGKLVNATVNNNPVINFKNIILRDNQYIQLNITSIK